ncbi:E3 ubiquitin-protein ligase NRDP1 isoform X1 [Lepeophtheirus salmonis]|uniref:E3 ubiquitin-protein ligase NRDP1 isoform X1 n=1 Tax=Lepeophtheirus salmonis TaxID=72036 RepID=UPI001AE233C0|nr:E3 ubiquitin-protein ligase NRDP1-like isoform X1 [Lepeophtheirus salmonis]
MGFEVDRFEGDVSEEFFCSICSGILEEAIQAPGCEHCFCSLCIKQWLPRHPTCPVDRSPLSLHDLKPIPRVLKNLLAKLLIRCGHKDCAKLVKLEQLSSHMKDCEFNPKKPVICDQGCGLALSKENLTSHNCITELKSRVENQEKIIISYEKQFKDLKERVHSLDISESTRNSTPDQNDLSEGIVVWANSLARAKVTTWGGIISTPDSKSQSNVKRSLIESGCPRQIAKKLMENVHEMRWPLGLLNLKTRRENQRQYKKYICRRIPNKQAVVVMACDNYHMSDDMIIEPGLVMIFAHGIE